MALGFHDEDSMTLRARMRARKAERLKLQRACGRSPGGHQWITDSQVATGSGRRTPMGRQILISRQHCLKCGKSREKYAESGALVRR